MRTRLFAMLLVTTLLGAARPAAASAGAHQAGPLGDARASNPVADPGRAPAQSNISCNDSPFGRVLTLGGDREVFAGYRGGFRTAQAGHILYDRIDLSGTGDLARSFASTASDAVLQSARGPLAATTADVDGDGTHEFVQVFHDSTGNLGTITYFRDGSTRLRRFSYQGEGELQAATLSRGDNTSDRVVVANRSTSGSLSVFVLNLQTGEVPNIFRSNSDGRQNLSQLRLAIGDMDLDGSRDDIAVAFREGGGSEAVQLVALKPDNVPATGSGSNFVQNMRRVDFERLSIGTPASLALAQGDLNGDYRDELILAMEQQNFSTPGISDVLSTYAYSLDSTTTLLAPYFTKNEALKTSQFALAAGDTDRDGRDELVRAYHSYGDNSGLVVETLDAEQPNAVVVHNRYGEASGPRSRFDHLTLDVGDMDRDAFDDIVVGVRDADRFINLVRLEDGELPNSSMTVVGQLRDGSGARTNHSELNVRLGDFDNDSLKAHYEAAAGSSLVCQRVVEPQINTAAFVPPYWSAIQATQPKSATVGESSSESQSDSKAITTSQSHSVSGYIGASTGVKDVVSFTTKITAGYKYATSSTNTTGTISSEKLTTARSNVEGDFLLVENVIYDCYSYQMRQTGAVVDGQVRFCEYKGRSVGSPSMDSWDANARANSAGLLHWAPVARDWANLALFPKTPAVQSSTTGQAVAGRANDGRLADTPSTAAVTRTNSEPAPWWQVDLDTVQPISKLRVWNRSYTDCGDGGCPQLLGDFNVFISNVDPRTISNDPAVLKADPRVHSFFFSGAAADIATVLTLDNSLEPVKGRFVRVQLAGSGVLSLAEVQVFGTNHVEPHRYPVGISDPTPNDGVFTVNLFDPRTKQIVPVQTRGNLLWNGTASGRNLLSNAQVEPGGGQLRWSIAKDAGTNSAYATTLTQSYRVGVQFDLEFGALTKVKLGGGYEFENGVGTQNVRSLQVTQGFEVGGTVTGFPSYVNNRRISWPSQCSYGLQPYYYEVKEVSNAGYAHRYLVVDYVVPQASLDRNANMAACQVERTGEPTFESTYDSGGPGSRFVLTAQNFAPGAPATIDVLNPGQTQFQRLASQTMDEDGTLVFVLETAADARPGDYQVRLTSRAVAGGPSVGRELTIRIVPGAQVRDDRPPGVPAVPAPATARRTFVPLAAK